MTLPLVRLFGPASSPSAYRLRDFLQRSGVQFDWTELQSSEDARLLAGIEGLADEHLPVCKLAGGSILFNPSVHDLASALEWFEVPKLRAYDLIIYGAGPAGLSAAVYGASEGLRTLVIERSAVGGQAASSSKIENYLGFPEGISGWELASRARRQAQRLGAEIIITEEAVTSNDGGLGRTELASGVHIESRATIIATGVDYTRLRLDGEDRLLNRGLYYGAGSSEAKLCTGHVFIVGGGNSAGQAALNFADHASQVTMLIRGDSLKETLSTYLADRIMQSPKIDVRPRTVLTKLIGTESVERIEFISGDSGACVSAQTQRVFVCIGGTPRTALAGSKSIQIDQAGYILTGSDLVLEELDTRLWSKRRPPLHMETSRPGMFAAGDVRHNSVKRCATAVGDGAAAVAMVHEFLSTVNTAQTSP